MKSSVLVRKGESLYALKSDHSKASFFIKRTMAAKWFKCTKEDLICLILPNVLTDRLVSTKEINKIKSL